MAMIANSPAAPKPPRKHRFKIEFIPPLLTLPFVAIMAYILLSNQSYFTLINSTLAGVFGGIQLNYVAILLALIFSIGGISVLFILIHIRRPTFLLIPLVILCRMNNIRAVGGVPRA